MQIRRNIKADLINFLREDWLIRRGIYENCTNITLSRTTNPDGGVVYKNPDYFNWIYYVPPDIVGVTYPPVIKDGGATVDPSKYTIHYSYGEVSFTTPPVGTVTANFAYLYYTVTEDGDRIFDLLDSPFSYIIIQQVPCREAPLEIGSTAVLQHYEFTIEVASYYRELLIAKARTDDIVEIVKRGLSRIPIIDYTNYFPLNANGDRVSAYNRATQTIGYYDLIPTIMDIDIPDYTNSREWARHSVSFTLVVISDIE